MNERLHHGTGFDLQRLNEMLHAFLMLFAPADDVAPAEDDIAWEDGEVEEEPEGAAR